MGFNMFQHVSTIQRWRRISQESTVVHFFWVETVAPLLEQDCFYVILYVFWD